MRNLINSHKVSIYFHKIFSRAGAKGAILAASREAGALKTGTGKISRIMRETHSSASRADSRKLERRFATGFEPQERPKPVANRRSGRDSSAERLESPWSNRAVDNEPRYATFAPSKKDLRQEYGQYQVSRTPRAQQCPPENS